MDMNCKNVLYIVGYVALAYVSLRIIQDNCDIGLGGFFRMVEGLDNSAPVSAPVSGQVMAAESMGHNSGPQKVQNLGRTPSTCYPQPALKAEDLLPKEDSAAIQEFNLAKPVGDGILSGVNMLDSGFHVGVNTVGQSLRNANLQLRSEPPNPQVNVSPWLMSSIGPDLMRRPLEDGEGCAASVGGPATADGGNGVVGA
jgi:hypothetical protein